jgi:hypothetical protein
VGRKQAKWFQSGRGKLCVNIGREDQKRGKFDLGGSLDDGKHPSKCKWF